MIGRKKGHLVSEETRRKISLANKGHIAWNKGLKGYKAGKEHYFYGKHRSEKTRQKISKRLKGNIPWNKGKKGIPSKRKGKKLSREWREKLSKAHKGKKPSIEHRKKISDALKGEKSYRWKGGITEENIRIRRSIEYRLWREAVFARDGWTCQKCGARKGGLNAHHIFNFADYPELRFALDNGITLCRKCHIEFHKKYGEKNNTKGQLEEFLVKN